MADKPQIGELVVLRGRDDHKPGGTDISGGLKALKTPPIARAAAAASKRFVPESLEELTKRKPGPLLDRPAIDALLDARKLPILRHHQHPTAPLTLSARAPYVEGHGWLNFFVARGVFGENGQAWFMRTDEGEDYRKIEVWLTGLTPGASYIVQLRVTGPTPGAFEIRGSDTSGVQTVPAGYQLTIPVLVHEVDRSMSLVTVAFRGDDMWGFYDATITAL